MRRIAILVAATALLAGCGDSGGADANGDGEITAEEMAAEAASGPSMQMEPGQWEMKMDFDQVDIPGLSADMKDMMMKQMSSGMTFNHCLTQDDVEKPNADFFGGDDNGDCTYQEFDRSGNTMKIRMTCTPDQGVTSTIAMDGEFSGDSFTMNMDNTTTGNPMGDMVMKGTMSGRRIGDCS